MSTIGWVIFIGVAAAFLIWVAMLIHAERDNRACPNCGKHRLEVVGLHKPPPDIRGYITQYARCGECGLRFVHPPRGSWQAIDDDEEWRRYVIEPEKS